MGKSKQNKQKTWEEKLEMLLSDNDCNCFVVNKDLKSFISAELQRARKEERKKTLEMLKDDDFLQSILSVKKIIKKLGE